MQCVGDAVSRSGAHGWLRGAHVIAPCLTIADRLVLDRVAAQQRIAVRLHDSLQYACDGLRRREPPRDGRTEACRRRCRPCGSGGMSAILHARTAQGLIIPCHDWQGAASGPGRKGVAVHLRELRCDTQFRGVVCDGVLGISYERVNVGYGYGGG